MHLVLVGMMGLAGVLGAVAQASPPAMPAKNDLPNFSGAWIYDAPKSAAMVRETTHRSVSWLLGDEAMISHANGALSMVIRVGTQTVPATYVLDGSESSNLSPGPPGMADIPIVSRARWVGTVLEITTFSHSEVDGKKISVESIRRLWLTAAGDLAIERRGTPVELVPTSASVYRRK